MKKSVPALTKFFASNREEIDKGFTQKGPHTDDFSYKMLDHSARNF